MKYLSVKNWDKFQHYKDRNPPWIKLHRTLLNDYDFGCLQDASKLHLMLIWLLASQTEGRIPDDPEFLKGKLGLKAKPDLLYLVNHGFLIPITDASKTLALDASTTLATCPLETEAYKEEKEKEPRANGALPDWVPEGPWKSWLEVRGKIRAPNTPRALLLAVNQLDKLRKSGYEPALILENATLRGWRGLFPVKEAQEAAIASLVQVCAKCARPANSLIQTSAGRLCPGCRELQ